MKVIKRNYEHRNLIIFLLFSMVYLQVIYSLSRGESILSVDALKSFFTNHYFILGITIVTSIMVLTIKKYSDKFLLLCLCLIAGKNFIMLATSFNKLILGLNFIYVLFAFYFFVMWELELGRASYNPLFSKWDLEKEPRFHLKGTMENIKSGTTTDVLVTNIDYDGCFIIADRPLGSVLETSNQYRLVAFYEEVEFVHTATLVSSYDRGFGMEFKPKDASSDQLSWSDLYKVCLQRGLF